MKKNSYILSFCLLFVLTNICKAQSVYIKVSGGYSWPGFMKTSSIKGFKVGDNPEPTSASIVEMMNIVDTSSINRSYKSVKGSYGQGGNIGLSVGYMFNKYVGVEMNMVYLFGSTISSTQISNSSLLLGPGAITKINTKASGLSLLPAIHLVAAVDGWKIWPYGRLGLSIPVWGSIKHDIDIEAKNPNAGLFPSAKSLNTKVRVDTDSKFSIGFVGAIGLTYKVHKMVNIWAEMNAQVLDVRAKKTTVKEFVIEQTDINGVKSTFLDLNDFPNAYSREVVFVNELTENSNNINYNSKYDKTKPKEELATTAPFHNIGVSVGITISIQTKKANKE